jgi:hypothetical protein
MPQQILEAEPPEEIQKKVNGKPEAYRSVERQSRFKLANATLTSAPLSDAC